MDGLPRPDRDELQIRAHKAAEIARDLKELSETDGWKTLHAIFAAAKSNYFASLSRQLMAGKVIDQRKLDFNRGLFAGVEQLLEQPARAESALQKAIQRLEEHDSEE